MVHNVREAIKASVSPYVEGSYIILSSLSLPLFHFKTQVQVFCYWGSIMQNNSKGENAYIG